MFLCRFPQNRNQIPFAAYAESEPGDARRTQSNGAKRLCRGKGMIADMRRDSRGCCVGWCCAAFGVGLLTAVIFPLEVILVLVAAALVLLGCSRVRSR